jgi:hypothetical protein
VFVGEADFVDDAVVGFDDDVGLFAGARLPVVGADVEGFSEVQAFATALASRVLRFLSRVFEG